MQGLSDETPGRCVHKSRSGVSGGDGAPRLRRLPPLIVGVILVLQTTPIQAQTDVAPLPVSIERIRAGLKEPPPLLRIPAAPGEMPTFRLEVRGELPLLQPVDEIPFDPTYGLPSVGELLMGGIGKIRTAVVNYTRGRAEHRARREVEDALAAFCATRGCPTSTTNK